MTTLLADIRFGARMLLKSPTMTFIALLALTLGIGANTAIFSVVNAVLLRSFPYADAERLVLVWEKREGGRTDQNVINLGNFSDWKEQNQVFSDMAVFFDRSFNLTSDGEPEEVPGQYGTTNLFSVLGTNAILGRTFVADDGGEGQTRVVVISYGLWQRRFGGDSQIVGRQITLNEQPTTIVGVLPANFGWHIQRGTQASKPADIWIPWQITNDMRQRRGRFAAAVARLKTGVCVTDANYFQTMQIPLRRGHLFTEQEATEMRHVVLVNEAFVRQNLGGQEPLGKRLTIYMKYENVPTEIIGVVADHKHLGLDLAVEPMAYWPHPELVYPGMTLMLRTRTDAAALAPAARNVIRAMDPQQPIGEVSTMESLLATSVARSRFSASLLTVFSFVALVMAAVGIYGVMSYSVLQRTHEIGVRMALGAQRFDVLKLMVKKGIVLAVVGVAAGLAASFGLTRLISTLLFDVTATDSVTFAAVSVGLFLVTLIACYVPARRATRVDPLKALRYE